MNMRKIQHGWQKIMGLLILVFLVVIGISACADGSAQSNITIQTCNGVVNVDSCTSANSDAQYTVIAGWQQNTEIQQEATRTSLDATITAQAKRQGARDTRTIAVLIGAICGGIACLMVFFALVGGSFKYSLGMGLLTVCILMLLLILSVVLIFAYSS